MNPPPYDPVSYYQPMANPRPTSVTVLAVIGIILGALALVCTPITLIPYFVKSGPPNPIIDAIKSNPVYFTWVVAATILRFIMALILVASSIGILSLARWGRSGMVFYAWVLIVVGILDVVMSIVIMAPVISSISNQQGPQAANAIGAIVGAMIGGVIALIYPIFVIVYMKKPHVKAAFGVADYPTGV